MKHKTLVILTPGFPEHEGDSTCIPPQQVFVKALQEEHPELNIVVLTFQYPFFSGEYLWHGIKVIAFGNPRNSRVIRRFTGLKVLRVLHKFHKETQIIGMLSFWLGKCAYIGNMFARRYGLKHYIWLLGQDAKAGNKYFAKTKPTADRLIALSDFLVREFSKNYGMTPAHVIPVGIDVTRFKESYTERNIDIIGAGSLIPLKQYDVFLEVIASLKTTIPDVKAVIIGEGTEMKRLKEMAAALGLTNNVSFAGRLPHEEVLQMMQRAKVFLHTSNYEGFGAVCLEALYAGAQVLSFVKPMDAAIENWHIAVDKTEMVNKLESLLTNPDASYQSVLPFNIQRNARAMMQLFESGEAIDIRVQPAPASIPSQQLMQQD
ncbi:glycosyltransferase family 4 protein [Mucilaginibacter rubeus]|uniref:Glycosyltransferase family 4 protein n=1 Tax=Mucilaginibacter rubeus TaxID=2027860 RepID=A0A5C1I0W9_9SPHI|nr:glycosyltransferase family 4 protein [Mucilaginibacter rubeus]QEM11449.1 glycosyltransferase family 4 protein [Mucilaginibacter rubeus]